MKYLYCSENEICSVLTLSTKKSINTDSGHCQLSTWCRDLTWDFPQVPGTAPAVIEKQRGINKIIKLYRSPCAIFINATGHLDMKTSTIKHSN